MALKEFDKTEMVERLGLIVLLNLLLNLHVVDQYICQKLKSTCQINRYLAHCDPTPNSDTMNLDFSRIVKPIRL